MECVNVKCRFRVPTTTQGPLYLWLPVEWCRQRVGNPPRDYPYVDVEGPYNSPHFIAYIEDIRQALEDYAYIPNENAVWGLSKL